MSASGREYFFPISAQCTDSGLRLTMTNIPVSEFLDAFCQQTIARFGGGEKRELFVKRGELQKLASKIEGFGPTGLIFHVSRCGSTLQSQVLKKISGLRVYSEIPSINDVLMPPSKWSRSENIAALRVIGSLLAQHADGPFIVKFRSWNSLFCDVITEAFPCSPWIFTFRDPVEVGVSVLTRPPTWMRSFNKPLNPFLPFVQKFTGSSLKEEYVAKMFAAFCDAIGSLDPSRGLLIDYRELPNAVYQVILPHFSLLLYLDDFEEMKKTSSIYAKSPLGANVPFRSDSQSKQDLASDALRRAMNRIADPILKDVIHIFQKPQTQNEQTRRTLSYKT